MHGLNLFFLLFINNKINILFIEEIHLKENLLSIGQIMENGYSLHFEKDTCKIYDSRKIEIGQVKMEKRNRSFPISFKPGTNISMEAEVDDSWLWHRRFGHFNTYALKLLYKQKNDERSSMLKGE